MMLKRISKPLSIVALALTSYIANAAPVVDTQILSKSLFNQIVGDVDLHQDQRKIFESIVEDPTTVDYVFLNLEQLPDDISVLKLDFLPWLDTLVYKRDTKQSYLGTQVWTGDIPETQGSTNLVIRKDAITGVIRSDNTIIQIRPLSAGLHIAFLTEQSKYPLDHPVDHDPQYWGEEPKNHLKGDKQAMCSTIDVLVAYTTEAANLHADLVAFAQLAINEANKANDNSNVTPHLRLVGVETLNYTEQDIETDLAQLQDPSDGVIDGIHTIRDNLFADVVVMMKANAAYCGLASEIKATSSTAFAVVKDSCAVGNLSFAHEIGHLQGARHNPEADPTNSPFKYGHGRYHKGKKFRTVMSYDCPRKNRTRVPYWSNPDVKYKNKKTGDKKRRDNARVLDKTSCSIAGFRQFPPPPDAAHTFPPVDVNGDGLSDIIFVGQNWNGPGLNIRTKFSNGDGTWTHKSDVQGDGSGVHAYPTLTGDVDDDGQTDLIFVGQNWNGPGLNIRTKFSNGDGTWTHVYDVQGDGSGVHVYPASTGDVDGDGKTDLIFVGQNWNGTGLNIRTKFSNGDGTWTHVYDVQGDGSGVHTYPMLLGTVDYDYRTDLIFVGQNWNGTGLNIRTKFSNGDGTWTHVYDVQGDGSGVHTYPALTGPIPN
jgi:hypothetical protein